MLSVHFFFTVRVSHQYSTVCSWVIKSLCNVNAVRFSTQPQDEMMSEVSTYSSGASLMEAPLRSRLIPEEVDVRVVGVLGLSGVASREGAEEGVGEQTCHLLLRHGDGVAHACLEEGYRLEGEHKAQPAKVKIICFVDYPNETLEHVV